MVCCIVYRVTPFRWSLAVFRLCLQSSRAFFRCSHMEESAEVIVDIFHVSHVMQFLDELPSSTASKSFNLSSTQRVATFTTSQVLSRKGGDDFPCSMHFLQAISLPIQSIWYDKSTMAQCKGPDTS